MHLSKKIATLLFAPLFLLTSFFTTSVFAVDVAPAGGTLVATVNIRDAKIVSQHANTFDISFSLTNREGVQSGVQYSVQLIAETAKGKVLADEKVFDEKINLSENTSIQKSITYAAPAILSGSYQLLLTSKNAADFPFAFYPLGKVTLTASAKGIQIDPASCYLQIGNDTTKSTLTQTAVLANSGQKLQLNCTILNASNGEVSVTPTLQTKLHGSYGEAVETAKADTAPISFKANEKKAISLNIPLASKPQTYNVLVGFTAGTVSSNTVSFDYVIPGASATISNLSLDKDYYKRGETAVASFVVFSSSTKVSVESVLISGTGMKCAKTLEQDLSLITNDIQIPITSSCRNPHLTVTIKDAKGVVLDQKEFSAETISSEGTTDTMPFIILIILVAIVCVGMLLKKYKKNSSDNTPPTPMSVLLPIIILAGLGSLIPFNTAKADSYGAGPGPNGGSVVTTVTVIPQVYGQNDDITVTWYIKNYYGSALPVTLRAVNNVGLGASNPSHVFLPLTTLASNAETGGGFPVSDSVTFDAPSSDGLFAIEFQTGVDVPTPIYVGVTQIADNSGSTDFCFPPRSYAYDHTRYTAEFFEDPAGTIPKDVSGLNFQLRQERYYNIPAWVSSTLATEIVYTPVASGTSYTYDGFSYDNGPTDGWGCSSSDQQTTYSGYTTLDDDGIPPVRYVALPGPPVASLAGPSGAYQNTPFGIGWSSQDATSCVGTNFSTSGSISGSVSVTQSNTTTYTVSCSGILGTDTKSIVVTDLGVAPPPPPPPVTCNAYPGQAQLCLAPDSCQNDPVHVGYEICQP